MTGRKGVRSMAIAAAALLGAGLFAAEPGWSDGGRAYWLSEAANAISSPEPAARIRARQELPREGLEAVPFITPFLASDDATIWRNAHAILLDILHRAAWGGEAAQREAALGSLKALLAPEQPMTARLRTLRLMPAALGPEDSVAPIAAMLREPDPLVRERARAALVEIASPPAAAALRAAAADAPPDFQVGLLDALAHLRDVEAAPLAASLAMAESAEVRLAAARCLAAAGRVQDLEAMLHIAENARGGTRREAGIAFVRYTEALIEGGGNFDLGMRLLGRIAMEAADLPVRGAALTSLGRHGDERAAAWIFAALAEDPEGPLFGPAVEGLAALQGPDAEAALIAAFPEQSRRVQLAMLRIFATRDAPEYLETMTAAANHAEAEVREAAIAGLVAAGSPAAAPLVAEALDAAADEESEALRRAQIDALLPALAARGEDAAAGLLYLARYRHAQDDAERAAALDGIRRHPVPEAYGALTQDGPEGLAAVPAATVAAIVRVMHEKGDEAAALEALKGLMQRPHDAGAVLAILEAGEALGNAGALRARLGFLDTWWLLGPFPWTPDEEFHTQHIDEQRVDLTATHAEGEDALEWRAHTSGHPWAHFDLTAIYGMRDYVTAYAFTEIELGEAAEALLLIGSDDGVKVRVNGELLHRNNADRGVALDEDRVPVSLRAGRNAILLQITQRLGGWGFCARLTGPDGVPITFERVE